VRLFSWHEAGGSNPWPHKIVIAREALVPATSGSRALVLLAAPITYFQNSRVYPWIKALLVLLSIYCIHL